jgi:glutamyl-tRNA reductase
MVCKRLYIAQFLLLVALCALQLHCSSAMKIGFLGLGTINNACATGLLTCAEPPTAVTVSPRNAAKAAALAAKFPELVTVGIQL